MSRFKVIQILAWILVLMASSAFISAGVPNLINYQGYLTDDAGQPVEDGEYPMQFKIHDDSIAYSPVWSSQPETTLVINGVFNFQLGSKENIPTWIFENDTALWLAITVGSGPEPEEIAPRTRLAAAPYAFQANHADYADTAMYALSGSIGMLFEDDNDYDVFYVSGEQTVKTFTIPAGQVEDYFRAYAYLEWHNLSPDLGIEAWLTVNTGGANDDTLEFFETAVGSAHALLESTVMEAYPGTWVARRSSIAYPWAWIIPSLDTSQPLEIGLHVRSIGSGVNEVRTGKIVIEYTKH